MRLFLGVELDETARRAARAMGDRLRRELVKSGAAREDDLKWLPPEAMHVTIHFLGVVDDASVPVVREVVGPASETPVFVLGLGGLGVFPPTGPARVVWIDVTMGTESLQRLHEELGKRLRSLGLGMAFETEQRPYRPHLTLGRFRRPGSADVRRVVTSARTTGPVESRIDHVTLFESRPSPDGQVYVALERTRLLA
jgi:2'-5' RNA ligase